MIRKIYAEQSRVSRRHRTVVPRNNPYTIDTNQSSQIRPMMLEEERQANSPQVPATDVPTEYASSPLASGTDDETAFTTSQHNLSQAQKAQSAGSPNDETEDSGPGEDYHKDSRLTTMQKSNMMLQQLRANSSQAKVLSLTERGTFGSLPAISARQTASSSSIPATSTSQPATMHQTPSTAPSSSQLASPVTQPKTALAPQAPPITTIVAPVSNALSSAQPSTSTSTHTPPALLTAFTSYSTPILHPDASLSIYYTERHGLLIDDAARASTTCIRNTILSLTNHVPVHPRSDPTRRRIVSLLPHVPLDSTRNLVAQAKHYGFIPLSATVASYISDRHSLLLLVKEMYMRIEVGECVVPEQLLAWEFEMAVEFATRRSEELREWIEGDEGRLVFGSEGERFEAKTALGRLTGARNLGARVRVAVGRANVLQSEGVGERVRVEEALGGWMAWCVGRGKEKEELVELRVEMELVKREEGEEKDGMMIGDGDEDVLEVRVARDGKCVLQLQSECRFDELVANLVQPTQSLRNGCEFDAPVTIPLRVTGVIHGLLELEEQRAKSAELEVLIVPGVDGELFMKLSVPSFLITDDDNLKKLVWCWGTTRK